MIDCSPIVINFADGPYQLTGTESPVVFDIRGNGEPVSLGWTAPFADEAFLCLDLNGDGKIDSGRELFGNATRLNDGSRAANGFVALADHDRNRDLLIDARDGVWPRLLLWRDLDHDGVSRSNELSRVAESSITAIGLHHHWTGRADPTGNALRYQAQIWIVDSARRPTPRPVYDVFFVLTQR